LRRSDFLPRGTGIVTRRPVMMYLHNVPAPPPAAAGGGEAAPQPEFVEFQHRPGQRFLNFDDVKAEIGREMERVAGRNKGIHAEPICLTIHSARVPDLVIIDLPGITKVPVGDQPADIELQVRRLCLHYMSQMNNIILAVHPANQDLANSDALKLAMEADPEGERTIGVLTKVDLMDPGTDAREALSGRVVALRRGFVPVVCRSQKDIAEAMPFSDGIARERAFFERHYAYRAMAARCGSAYLTRTLSHMLFTAIRAHLPSVRSQLSLAAQSYEQQLRELGDPVEAAGPKEQGHLVLKLLSRFATNFCDMIEGRVHADAGSDLLIDELFGGARIQEIVRTRFNQWTAEWEQLMDSQLRDDEILMAVRNSAGPRSALFIPEQAFTSLVRRQIVQLKDLGRRFADEIYDELRRIADKCEPPQLYRFGELREKAVEVVQNLLRSAFLPTLEMIDRLIDIEVAHVNTTHPDFVGAARALEYVLLAEQHQQRRRHAADGGSGGGDEGGGDPGAGGDEFDGGAAAAASPQERAQSRRQAARGDGNGGAARRPGGGEAAASNAAAGDDSSDDVAWAMRRLGVNGVAGAVGSGSGGGSNSSSSSSHAAAAQDPFAGFLGVFGRGRGPMAVSSAASGGDAAAGARGGARQQPDDIRARFGPRVVNEMLGEDSLLLGAVKRVGGPNSPFVELPRQSPHGKGINGAGAGGGGGGGAGAGAAGGGGASATFAQPSSPAVHFMGGGRGDRWATPGSVNGVAALGSRHVAAAPPPGGAVAGMPAPAYQGMALLVVPQKPLPEVITPSDLRPDEKEQREIRIIRALLQSYLGIVKKNYTGAFALLRGPCLRHENACARARAREREREREKRERELRGVVPPPPLTLRLTPPSAGPSSPLPPWGAQTLSRRRSCACS
jgi:dynamin 1-like protein